MYGQGVAIALKGPTNKGTTPKKSQKSLQDLPKLDLPIALLHIGWITDYLTDMNRLDLESLKSDEYVHDGKKLTLDS